MPLFTLFHADFPYFGGNWRCYSILAVNSKVLSYFEKFVDGKRKKYFVHNGANHTLSFGDNTIHLHVQRISVGSALQGALSGLEHSTEHSVALVLHGKTECYRYTHPLKIWWVTFLFFKMLQQTMILLVQS